MESSQLRRISIIGISILCLSPLEFFSNKLFEDRKETNDNIVIASSEIKLEPNYLSNNYEIFNPNIKANSEDIVSLVSENKKKEITEREDNLESETTNEKKEEESTEKTEEESEEEIKESKETKVAVKEVEETKTSTKNKEIEVSNNTEKTTTVSKKEEVPVEQPKEEIKVEQPKEAPEPNTDVATSLVNFAKQFVGYPYKSGGTDLYNGVDCSGFTMKVYEQFGYSLPHASKSQASYGSYVSIDNLMPGDLIFYGYNGSISHVAIYIGNGQIVHATTNTGGIKIASYTMMPIITARRILN